MKIRYLTLAVALGLMGLYSPAKVYQIDCIPTYSPADTEVPNSISHFCTITADCKIENHMSVEVECGEDGLKTRSPRTQGNVVDNVPPICSSEYTFSDVCLRNTAGTIDDIVRVYDRDRNSSAVKVPVTTAVATGLRITTMFLNPTSGPPDSDPFVGGIVSGGAPPFVWDLDCDDNPATGTDGFETTIPGTGFSVSAPYCPPFSTPGDHAITIRVRNDTGSVCPSDDCYEATSVFTVIGDVISIAAFTPSVTTGDAPVNDVEFTVGLDTAATTCPYDGDWTLSLACAGINVATCGAPGGDLDCDTEDGCCYLDNIGGSGVSTTSGPAAAFACDYPDGGTYNPAAKVACNATSSATASRTATITVGVVQKVFGIDPVITPTTGPVGSTFTMSSVSCTGDAVGDITQGTIRWNTNEATSPVTFAAGACTLTGGPYTHVYTNTTSPKIIQLCARRDNVNDCTDVPVTVTPTLTLGATLLATPLTGNPPLTVTASVDFSTGSCSPRTISNSTCGANCTGNFDVVDTTADPYIDPTPCSCSTGASQLRATVSCPGAQPLTNITGPTINVGTTPSFNILPVPSPLQGTAGSTNIILPVPNGVSCSGNVTTGPITDATVTMDKFGGVAPSPITISSTCQLTGTPPATIYTTPGQKTIEVCATRVPAPPDCGQATVNIQPAILLAGNLVPDKIAGTNDSLPNVSFTVTAVTGPGYCAGPWEVFDGDCGLNGTPANGGINTSAPSASPVITLTNRCNYTTGNSTPKAKIRCAGALDAQMTGQTITVTGSTDFVFTLNNAAVPATGVANQFCDANSCYLQSDISTSCGGNATGYIYSGGIEYIEPTPLLPTPNDWYDGYPVVFNQATCQADIAFAGNENGRKFPPGTWKYQVCARRQTEKTTHDPTAPYVLACAPVNTVTVTAGNTPPNFTLTGDVNMTVQMGTPGYTNPPNPWISPPVALKNVGGSNGSYRCSVSREPLPSYPFEAMTVSGGDGYGNATWTGTLAPGVTHNFTYWFDVKGIDGNLGTADDIKAGTYKNTLTCENTAVTSNVVTNEAVFTVSAGQYADLRATANQIDFVVTEGALPETKFVELYCQGGLTCPFTIQKGSQGATTFVNCKVMPGGNPGQGTAPAEPATIKYECTTASGLTKTQFPNPVSVTDTITRTQ